MEIEELTKSQIILLVLLVSFVTSIATGIVTVSLLAQTPPAVTQTINRVVERTVETVVPSENQAASVVTKETTVVVKEDDLIAASIESGFESVARIHEGVATTTPVVALGSITGEGTIITDLSYVDAEHIVELNGEFYIYEVSKTIPELDIAFLTAVEDVPQITALRGVDVTSIKLGQTMVGLYGARADRVAMSVASAVTEFETFETGNATVTTHLVETTITEALTPGTPLISIFGDLVGISTSISRADGNGSFVSFGDINALLDAETANPSEEQTEETVSEE